MSEPTTERLKKAFPPTHAFLVIAMAAFCLLEYLVWGAPVPILVWYIGGTAGVFAVAWIYRLVSL